MASLPPRLSTDPPMRNLLKRQICRMAPAAGTAAAFDFTELGSPAGSSSAACRGHLWILLDPASSDHQAAIETSCSPAAADLLPRM
jgi:hypothetical protein